MAVQKVPQALLDELNKKSIPESVRSLPSKEAQALYVDIPIVNPKTGKTEYISKQKVTPIYISKQKVTPINRTANNSIVRRGWVDTPSVQDLNKQKQQAIQDKIMAEEAKRAEAQRLAEASTQAKQEKAKLAKIEQQLNKENPNRKMYLQIGGVTYYETARQLKRRVQKQKGENVNRQKRISTGYGQLRKTSKELQKFGGDIIKFDKEIKKYDRALYEQERERKRKELKEKTKPKSILSFFEPAITGFQEQSYSFAGNITENLGLNEPVNKPTTYYQARLLTPAEQGTKMSFETEKRIITGSYVTDPNPLRELSKGIITGFVTSPANIIATPVLLGREVKQKGLLKTGEDVIKTQIISFTANPYGYAGQAIGDLAFAKLGGKVVSTVDKRFLNGKKIKPKDLVKSRLKGDLSYKYELELGNIEFETVAGRKIRANAPDSRIAVRKGLRQEPIIFELETDTPLEILKTPARTISFEQNVLEFPEITSSPRIKTPVKIDSVSGRVNVLADQYSKIGFGGWADEVFTQGKLRTSFYVEDDVLGKTFKPKTDKASSFDDLFKKTVIDDLYDSYYGKRKDAFAPSQVTKLSESIKEAYANSKLKLSPKIISEQVLDNRVLVSDTIPDSWKGVYDIPQPQNIRVDKVKDTLQMPATSFTPNAKFGKVSLPKRETFGEASSKIGFSKKAGVRNVKKQLPSRMPLIASKDLTRNLPKNVQAPKIKQFQAVKQPRKPKKPSFVKLPWGYGTLNPNVNIKRPKLSTSFITIKKNKVKRRKRKSKRSFAYFPDAWSIIRGNVQQGFPKRKKSYTGIEERPVFLELLKGKQPRKKRRTRKKTAKKLMGVR